MFYGLALVSIFGGLLFLCMGSGEAPDWAKYDLVQDIEEGEETSEKEKPSVGTVNEEMKDVG